MEVEFELTPEDAVAFQRFHQKHPPVPPKRGQNPILWAVVFVGVLTLISFRQVVAVGFPILDELLSLLPLSGVGFGALLALAGVVWYAKWMAPNATLQKLKEGRNAEKVLGWRRFSIDARAIRTSMDFSATTYLWKGIDAITASKDHVFLYISTTNAYVVPRRAFPSDRAFEDFVEAARRYHGMAGVGEAVREVIGEHGAWERRGPTGVQAPVDPSDAGAAAGIVPKEGPPLFGDRQAP